MDEELIVADTRPSSSRMVNAPWAVLARLGGRGEGPAETVRTDFGRPPARPGGASPGLLVVASPQPALLGAFFRLGAGGATVGRGCDASVRLDDGGVSRRHLRITGGQAGVYTVEDQGSSNGTYLNGVRVRSADLAEGDRIQLGAGTELVFGREAGTGSEEARLRQALAAAGAAAWETRRQSLLLDSLPDGILAMGFDGTVLDWNVRAEEIFGLTRAEVCGRRLAEVLPSLDALGAAVVRRVRAGEREPEEGLLLRKGGSEVAVEVAALPLRAPDGRPLACVAVVRDVDERRRMATQLHVAGRLASLGTLAAGVAHEINNPLAFISSNLHWLRKWLETSADAAGGSWEEVRGALADCLQGAERIGQIVQDLKTHASIRSEAGASLADAATDPNAAMEFALRVAEHEMRRRARLVRELRPVPAVKGEATQLGQVFLDLLLNAAQAIPAGAPEENEIRVRSQHDEGSDSVLFAVEDTGSGMTPHVLGRIFDPFYTTRPPGSGTGLGLFVCHGIVCALGGKITVESQVGRGSSFRVLLPVA